MLKARSAIHAKAARGLAAFCIVIGATSLVAITVNAANPPSPTTTTAGSLVNFKAYVNAPVTFYAQVRTDGSGTVAGSTASFTSNDAPIDGCQNLPVVALPPPPVPNGFVYGEAKCNTSYPEAGTYTIQASYSGNSSYAPSQSPTFQQIVIATCDTNPGGTSPIRPPAGQAVAVVQGCPAPPVAVNDTYTTPYQTTLTVPAPGVMSNDTDASATPFTSIQDSNPSSGTATLNTDGSLTYIPAAGFSGNVTLTYHDRDNFGQPSNQATVTIAVGTAPTPTPTPTATPTPSPTGGLIPPVMDTNPIPVPNAGSGGSNTAWIMAVLLLLVGAVFYIAARRKV